MTRDVSSRTSWSVVSFCFVAGLCLSAFESAEAQVVSGERRNESFSPSSRAFLKSMASYDKSLDEQAVGFLVGGSVGVGLSLALATRADEALSKTGLSVLAASSTVGILHGVGLLVRGDAITREAENLFELDRALRRAGVASERRERILDESLLARLLELRRRRDDLRQWNGIVSLVVSAAGGAAIALSKNESTGGQIGLALFTLTTGVYGLASILPRSGSAGISELQADFRLDVFPAGPGATLIARLP